MKVDVYHKHGEVSQYLWRYLLVFIFPTGGLLLLELNRILRPGGYFVWSATPVYQNDPTDQQAWNSYFS